MSVVVKLAEKIRDTIWPPRCLGCSTRIQEGRQLTCPSCAPTIRGVSGPRCPTCALPRSEPAGGLDTPCKTCRDRQPAQAQGFARWLYDGTIAHSIQRAKYAGETWRLRALGAAMRPWLDDRVLPDLPESDRRRLRLTVVPLHRSALRDRGFNQAVHLAKSATRPFEIPPHWSILKRSRKTRTQAGLSLGERIRNVRDAFEVTDPERAANHSWLVVDDVATTGATLTEVAGTLHAAGAPAVYTLVAARTPDDRTIPGRQ